ncbi:hypothetical protein C1S82_08290 [Mycolicibacterium cosmeticum]|uniref:Transmembrane protein n=1 Tax=Mycolicibacterium cosmeticum TaxID=258533 RepID=W9AW43_MYCCO|nr:hypothetical protein [Mycolicibacterium cosmeticum]TLH74594.1 hypothetical protein C1S82_08290 [Mycolicibacterium cosmeticum]CDO09743.1 hypothetical protein BN977_04571 [Mycolicibacterium cosmeticum]
MTAAGGTPVRQRWSLRNRSVENLHPVTRMFWRWGFIAILTVVAFHRSLASAWATTVGGGFGGYVWLVPIAALLAAIGIARRNRTELPIHDRQTDIIVATMGLVMALLVHGVLLQRYSLYFHLLRLDLVAMWLFIVSASVAMFGLRPVIRFGWAWLVLFMVFPLPYYVTVILLGGNRLAAGVGTMVIAAAATATAVGRKVSRGMVGSNLAWLVGLVMLGFMAVFMPNAHLITYQYVPALTSICLVASLMFLADRWGLPKRVLDRKLEPLAARQIWSAVPLVLVIAALLSVVRLPEVGLAPAVRVEAMDFGAPLKAPPGWRILETQRYDWVTRFYGRGAVLVRQKMVAETGNPVYDKFSRPRTIMVDSVTTLRPFSLNVYPSRMLYRINGIRLSGVRPADLGYGVPADLFSVIDDRLLVTWDGLQWTWTNGEVGRRILAIAVDNHEDWAPFPQPTGGVAPTLNSLFTVLFRGNSAAANEDPDIKDDDLLTEFGHALVRAQMEPLGVAP